MILFIHFEFWDGMQNHVPNVWEVVFPHISIEGGAVHHYVHGLVDAIFRKLEKMKVKISNFKTI